MTTAKELVSELPCGFCRRYNRLDRTFCLGCRRRLIAFTPYDVSEADFVCKPDRDNLEVLQGTEPLPRIIAGMVQRRERSIRSRLETEAAKVQAKSKLDSLIRSCGETLALDIIPEAFILRSNQINAAVFGSDEDPVLMVTTAALSALRVPEMTTIIGHELGHVKSKHLVYHTLAESLGSGAQILAGFYGAGLIGLPIQMMLLAWHRESEISADRASLLVVGDTSVFTSLMLKLMGQNASAPGTSDDSIVELFQTHPNFARRLATIKEFATSPEYARGREKVRLRLKYKRALTPICRYCGSVKPVTEFYCRACGKSQL